MHSKHRLSNNKDFVTIYKKGKSFANRYFVLYIYKHAKSLDPFRLGVSVSKKVGNAVVRNRIKRLVKEVFLSKKDSLPTGYDFVIIARNAASTIDYQKTNETIEILLKKSKIIRSM
ncbi:ribonuclease P protein component [Desulfuribacillus alkaliarsenatis]|uniref:Ribonuclease P protein component n=1 Tax=Desulfuribacillus alkaliarsenatis TaxID=766136 RepID=A0A1E5G2J7_9FIRM|nr:ribonuclease P protein component [Desulfuribacillus alkaliarsenatis]OEF97315.1 ribonuclease P protein component [Desulfuribacillus alkaliarsenatis]